MKKTLFVALLMTANCALYAQEDRAEAQKNPFDGNAQAAAAGKTLYNQACVSCHGPDAQGDRGPSLASGTFSHGNADGEIFINIRSGVRGTGMPAFPRLTTEQVWQLITYFRSLAPVTVAPRAGAGGGARETVAGDAAAGKSLFSGAAGCSGCHQVGGAGTAVGPDLTGAGRMPAAQLLSKITNPNQPPAAAPAAAAGRGGRGRGPAGPVTVTAKTKEGQEYRGIRKSQDSLTVQFVDTTGKFHSLEKKNLASLQMDAKSIMPDDYSKRLTAPQLQNIVAYLKTLNVTDPSQLGQGTGLTWERIRDSDKEPQNWLSYWGQLSGQHFSALNQINSTNVKNLQAKWAVQIPGDTQLESVPLVVDGIMYTTGHAGQVFALDAKTGHQIWRYERKQKVQSPYQINPYNRGLTVLGNRVFFGTLDAALIALDARTGEQLWEVQVEDTMKGYTFTSPPLVVKDKLIMGISGGEFGIRGFVDAYDPASGKRLWRWYSVPAKGEFGNDTWEGDSWMHGAAATWLTGTYDPTSDTIYWPIGNPGPDINGDVRKGDNLFSCSVVALDPQTGQRKWHYQFTPNDTHDWDSTEDVIVVDRKWHGQDRKLLLHADRNGVFYVLDRTNGKLLLASPFVRASWVTGWDDNGRPITTPNWRANEDGVTVYPALGGGTNFQAPSYSPQTGLFYSTYHDGPGRFSIGPAPFEEGKQFQGRGSGGGFQPPPAGATPDSQGIMAMDPETGKTQWRFEVIQSNLASGVMSTAGNLVFVATAEGTFIALDAKTGQALWSFVAGGSLPSSPMSYSVDGKQYVTVASAGVLYTFGLP